MAETTKIQWTDHTFNPWRGCTKVHAGCAHCYAERESKRNPGVLGVWGDMGTRVVAAEKTWGDPLKWNKAAEAAGERRRVFCASLADVFEDWGDGHVSGPDGRVWVKPYLDSESQPENWQLEDEETMRRDSQGWRFVTLHDVRARLFALIDATPWLDWQLLTKRPENVRRMWPSFTLLPPNVRVEHALNHPHADIPDSTSPSPRRPNVWIGTSVSDQETADKYVPELLKLRDLTPVLFLSIEPLLGPVDLRPLLPKWFYECQKCLASGESDDRPGDPCGCEPADGNDGEECDGHLEVTRGSGIDWIIVGGESGPKARPCRPEWILSIVEQCRSAGVPCFVKQLGQKIVVDLKQFSRYIAHGQPFVTDGFNDLLALAETAESTLSLCDKKGGDPDEWGAELRVRQFPRVERVGA